MAVSRYIGDNCVFYEELIENTSCVIVHMQVSVDHRV